MYQTNKAHTHTPVDSKLLLLIRGPGRVLLICWELGFVKQNIHQLEIHGPVDLKVHCPLLHLKGHDFILRTAGIRCTTLVSVHKGHRRTRQRTF